MIINLMLLLLVRHALAADRDPTTYPDDSLRPLLPKGRKVQARMARTLARRNLVPSVIFASPWKRAWQTAAILSRETGAGKKRRVPCPPLAEDPVLESLAQTIGPRHPDEIVALVGHEPWMSELAALLLGGTPNRPSIAFPKSAVMGISTESMIPGSGTLRFFLTPARR